MSMNFDVLNNGVAVVTFTKANGESRTMKCTRAPKIIDSLGGAPKTDNLRDLKTSIAEDYVCAFDLVKNAWRAFKPSKVTAFAVA